MKHTPISLHIHCMHSPGAPFQNALGPSAFKTLRKASAMFLYVCWPVLAFTCSLVLMTSAGVTNPAAGTPVHRWKEEGGEGGGRREG